MEEHRAEMIAPCNVLGTDFCLQKHLIPGRHILISIQVLGGSQEERELIIRILKVKLRWAPLKSKAGLGTHSEAIICCLGGRGSQLQWGGDRALFLDYNALSVTCSRQSRGPCLALL